MQWILLIVTVVHVLPAVFWVGSTFVLTRAGGVGADRLAFPELGAAALTTLSDATPLGSSASRRLRPARAGPGARRGMRLDGGRAAGLSLAFSPATARGV